jgi:flagellar biosynthesis anti-sigma factor FlgM
MDNRENQDSGRGASPDNHNGNGQNKGPERYQAVKDAALSGNKQLMERVHQIISETSEIRPEKVGPLQEAVAQGAYSIDVRKLANILIAELFLAP